MSNVNPLAQQSNAANQTGQAAAAMTGADFNMFLKLLTTQMQHQDPLDPMDTSEYTQQLVQYSQVEQSIQQTGVLQDILSRLAASDMAQASSFIGREGEFDTNVAGLADKPAEWSYIVAREAASITATVTDSAGKVVATKVLEPGSHGRFTWDGALAEGGAAPHGAYALTLKALDSDGKDVPTIVSSVGVIDSVTSIYGDVMLGVNGVEILSGSLIRVSAKADS